MGPAGCNLLTLNHPSSKTNWILFASAVRWMLWKVDSEMEINRRLLGVVLGMMAPVGERGGEGSSTRQGKSSPVLQA